jgi:hypothetical protein
LEDLRKVLRAPALTLKAAKFMRNTGLLGQFKAVPDTIITGYALEII